MLSIFFHIYYIRGRQHTRIVRYRSTFHFNMITARHYSSVHWNGIEAWYRFSIAMNYIHSLARTIFTFALDKMRIYESINKLRKPTERGKCLSHSMDETKRKNYFHFIFSTFLPMVRHHLPCVRFYRSAYSLRGRLSHFISALLLFAQRSLARLLARSLIRLLHNRPLFHFTSFSNSIKRNRIHG